jgi:topoisomerase-4 subunit B
MNPLQLRETTMDPNTRRLVMLTLDAKDSPDATIDMLLAKNRAGDRKQWLTEEGNRAEILD